MAVGRNSENPVKRVKAPKVPKRELRPIKPDDIRLLIQVAQGTRLEVPVAVAAVTGLRRSELLALRWSNTDLDRKSIFVSEALEHTRQSERVRFKGPKSRSSRRTIPIGNDCVALLRKHRVEQDEVRANGVYSDRDLVFPNPDGNPWPPDTFSVQFAKLARLVGMKGFRFHDVRHAFATLALADGRSAKEVQALMGHSSMVTTLDIYAHQVEGLGREAVEGLAKSLLGKVSRVHVPKCSQMGLWSGFRSQAHLRETRMKSTLAGPWRGGRVVEGGGLEMPQVQRHAGSGRCCALVRTGVCSPRRLMPDQRKSDRLQPNCNQSGNRGKGSIESRHELCRPGCELRTGDPVGGFEVRANQSDA